MPKVAEELPFFCVSPAVGFSDELSDGACRLLIKMGSLTYRSGSVRLTMTELAELTKDSERSAWRKLSELKRLGLVTARQLKGGYRAFRLTEKALVKAAQPPAEPVTRPAEVCDGCKKLLPITAGGVCVACCRERRENDAYSIAKAQLPTGATHEEVSAKVLINKASRKLERARREVEREEDGDASWMGPDELTA